MTPSQYAATINRSKRTVTNWCNAGLIPCKRIGGLWEIAEDAVPPEIKPKRKKRKRSKAGQDVFKRRAVECA